MCVKAIKAFEAFGEDLLIGQSLLCPSLKDLFDAEALDPVKLVVLEVGIVYELGDSQNRSIPYTEPLDQRFESAAVRVMAELHFKHIVRYRLRGGRGCVRKDEFGVGVDKSAD